MRKVEIGNAIQKAEIRKAKIGKTEMNQGRLTEEFRDRTKAFAAGVIRLYIKLPKAREEVKVLGKQLLRSGTSVAAHTWPVKYNDDLRLRASLYSR